MRIHPLAALIPEMAADQFAELRDDIAQHGLNMPIVLHEDMVLDGRHRLRACDETGVEPRFEEFGGSSPVEFVLSMNVKRRHLTVSQRAAIAMAFLPAAEEEARQRMAAAGASSAPGHPAERVEPGSQPLSIEPPRRAREDVGRMAGVSGATIDRARRVAEEDPEMFEQVKNGTLPVRTADTMLRERVQNGTVTRDGSRKRTADHLVGNVIDRVLGTVAALQHIDLEAAVASEYAPLAEWDKNLTDIIVPLNRLRGEIRKVLTDG